MVDIFNNSDVCRLILSYSKNDFLFTGTINKTSHDSYVKEHDSLTTTTFSEGMYGFSRTEESTESGFRKMLNVYKHAIRLGRSDRVLQLYENRLCMDLRECFVYSIRYKRLGIFEWISSKVDRENTYWFNLAAQFGDIECLKILKDMGFSWSSDTSLESAEFGKIDGLRWLYEKGCPMDERVIVRAAVKGYEDIVVWCSDIICEPPIQI